MISIGLGQKSLGCWVFTPQTEVSCYVVAGITRDSTGAILPLCNVELYAAETSTLVGKTISDADGYYEIEPGGYDRSATFFVRAWKADPRTNYLPNSALIGAVVGTSTLPQFFSIVNGFGAVALTVTGAGQENGFDFVDIRFNGTSNNTGGTLGYSVPVTTVSSNVPGPIQTIFGEVWAHSIYLSLVGGTLANVSAVNVGWYTYDAAAGFAGNSATGIIGSLTSAQQRFSDISSAGPASAAYIWPRLGITWTNAAAIDFTLRLAAMQMEKSASVTAFIRTVSGPVTIYDVNSVEGTTLPTLKVA